MDGTLVDSAAATERTWHRWAQAHGAEDRLTILHGQPAMATVRACFPEANDEELHRLCAWQVEAERRDLADVVAMAGAAEILQALTDAGVAWIVVTSADLPLARARLTAAGIAPPAIVSVDDVTHGKPHPEPFLLGADRLGLPIDHTLVVEDSRAGVRAGLASGAVTAALNGHAADVMVTGLMDLHRRLRW